MKLTSRAFSDGEIIPQRYTCDGRDLSPPLSWSDVPEEARSLVILCEDPDAPSGTWHHWAAYDISPDKTALTEGVPPYDSSPFQQGKNDFGRPGYGGPCPPRGHGAHRYRFQLLALSIGRLPVPPAARCVDVAREARKHLIGEAVLVGSYQR